MITRRAIHSFWPDGDGSTLSLDFTTGVLDPRLTFTRASTATYINSQGYVTTMAAAPTNDPTKARFDYDPTTLSPRGLLIEGASTNLLCWSESFATSGGTTNWSYNGNSGATVTETNPAGGSTTFQFRETSGSGPLSQTVTTVSTSPYTLSFWVRASVFNSVTTTQLQVGIFTTAFQTVSISKISGPGSVSGTGLCTVSGLSLTEWTKIQITTTGNIGAASASVSLYPQTASFETDRSFLIWGAQLETGSGASSYIPTGASTATRAADSCVMTGTNFSSWFAGATEGVLYSEFERPRSESGNTAHDHAAVGSQYGSGTGWSIYVADNILYPTTLLWPTGGPVFPGGFPSAIPAVTKQAAKWFGGNDAITYSNGAQGATGAGSGTLAPNMLCIGANSASGTAATRDWLNACVRRVKFWPVALPDSQIIALTTP